MDSAEVVRAVAQVVRDRYVFPELGATAASSIADCAYDGLGEAELCQVLTANLHAVCPDHHLAVVFRPEGLRTGPPDEVFADQARLQGYGVSKVERLDDNIGYLDLRNIHGPEFAGAALSAAMTLLAHTRAFILDLRANRGGHPDGVAFLCSHFLPPEPVHLNDVYSRVEDATRQYWSWPFLSAPRYLGRPVYVLTGPQTFSGGEEIAYNLQQLTRAGLLDALLIGETTRGGAHPTDEHWVAPHICVRVPQARSINPFTGTNWEGVGVSPDLAVPAAEALAAALGQIRPSSSA